MFRANFHFTAEVYGASPLYFCWGILDFLQRSPELVLLGESDT